MTEPVGNLPSVPGYALERLIGAGSAGQVFRARHTPTGQPVAIRMLPQAASAPTLAERLTRELRAVAGLRHPNLIEVYTSGVLDQRTFIIMELAQGGSLRDLLRTRAQSGPLQLELCLDLAQQAAEALAYLHERTITHGAVKPENLLLMRPIAGNEPPQLKLSDTGLTWLADELNAGATVVTSPAAPYLSPEQCQGEPVGPASDLYSLGIVIYELVTGLPPFPVETLTDAIQRHVFVPAPLLRSARADAPPALEALVARCLAKTPAERIPRAAEVAAELAAIRDSLLRLRVVPPSAPDAPTMVGGVGQLVPIPSDPTVLGPIPANPPIESNAAVASELPIDATVVAPIVPMPASPVPIDATVIAPIVADVPVPTDATVIAPIVADVPVPIDATVIAPIVADVPVPIDATVVAPIAQAAPPIDPPTPVLEPKSTIPEPEASQPADASDAPPRGSYEETVIGPVPVVVPPFEPMPDAGPETVPPIVSGPVAPPPVQAASTPVVPTPGPVGTPVVAVTPAQGSTTESLLIASPPPSLPIAPPMQTLPQVQVFDQAGRQVELVRLTGDGLGIGRSAERDLIIEGPGIADDHVFIDYDGKQITVSDQGSATGTQIGGMRLRQGVRQLWESSALVRIGTFWLRLVPPLPTNETVMGIPVAGPTPTPPRQPIPAGVPGPSSMGSTPTVGVPLVARMPTPPGIPVPNVGQNQPVAVLGNQMSNAPGLPQRPAQPVVSAQAVSPTDPPTNDPVSTDRLKVELEQDTLTLTPGQTAVLRMTLYNQGNQVDHLRVKVDGVPETWISSQPPVQLLPGRSQPAALTVNVPRTPESRAGGYPVTIYGQSTNVPGEAAVTQAQWTVLPFADSMLELKPKRAEGWRTAGYSLALTNNGNQRVRYQLTGEDDEQLLDYGLPPEQVELEPGGSFKRKMTVRGPLIPLGSGQQRSFTVYAKPDKKGDQQSVPAQFVQRALLPLWVIPILMVALVGFIAWAIQPPQIEASLSPAPQIIGQPAKLKWNTTNARQVLILPLNITAEAAGGEFTFADSTSIPANLRVEASTLFGVQRTAVPTVYVLAPTATPVATPVPPTLTPLPTLEPLPTLAPQPPGPALPTLAPLPTAPPLPTATLPPAEIVATIKDCRAGVRVLITGSGPAQAPYLLFFGRRAVAGGSVAANGRFQTSLLIGKERPGTYPVTVRQRLSDRLLLMQSYQLGTTDPVVLPPTFNDGSPINIICVVPTVLPTPTVGPAAAP